MRFSRPQQRSKRDVGYDSRSLADVRYLSTYSEPKPYERTADIVSLEIVYRYYYCYCFLTTVRSRNERDRLGRLRIRRVHPHRVMYNVLCLVPTRAPMRR